MVASMISRRGLFGILGAALASATLDPERLLWNPGKLISIPKAAYKPLFTVGDAFTMAGVFAVNPITSKETEILQHFIITKMTENGEQFWPGLIPKGQYMNVSRDPGPCVTIKRCNSFRLGGKQYKGKLNANFLQVS